MEGGPGSRTRRGHLRSTSPHLTPGRRGLLRTWKAGAELSQCRGTGEGDRKAGAQPPDPGSLLRLSLKAPGEEGGSWGSRPPPPPGPPGTQRVGISSTHCGWPRWACRPPRCRVPSTIRRRCRAASAPGRSDAYSAEAPLPARAQSKARGQREGPGAPSVSRGARPRGHCPSPRGTGPALAPHPTPPFVSDFSAALLPASPPPPSTKHSIIPDHNWF